MTNAPAPMPAPVKGLGEIAIRCQDLGLMMAFYRDIAGLELLSDQSATGIVFFRISAGYAGHTTILALFLPSAGRPALHPHTDQLPIAGKRSSLHHLALSVDYANQPALMDWLKQRDISFNVQIFDWIGWRGVFVQDPEGNVVEFVAADPDWSAKPG